MCPAVLGGTLTADNHYDYYHEADSQQMAQGGPATGEISGSSETSKFIIISIKENDLFCSFLWYPFSALPQHNFNALARAPQQLAALESAQRGLAKLVPGCAWRDNHNY